MSKLGRVVEAVENYNEHVLDEVKRARTDKKFGQEMLDRWKEIKSNIEIGTAPTGLKLPRLALPEIDEPGEIARYLLGDGIAGAVSLFEWRLPRDVSRATAGHAGRNFARQEWSRKKWQERCAEISDGGGADAFVLRSYAGGGHEQTFSFFERASALEATQHCVRRTDALRHRQRRGWRLRQNRRGRCRGRYGRRHGTSL